METNKLQKRCFEVVDKLDKKFGIDRTPQLTITQLLEELGELARDVNSPKLRGEQPDKENLSGEFADVFMLFCALAEMHTVDLEKSWEKKIVKLKARGYLD